MDYSKVLNLLDTPASKWANELDEQKLADILQIVYSIETYKTVTLEQTLNDLSQQLKANVTPEPEQYAANTGKKGELTFEQITNSLPDNYKITNMAKSGHVGDFLVEYSSNGRVYRLLVDIKLYKSTVPKKEIDKFHHDLSYGSYDAGLLVSYKSNFVGRPNSITMESTILPYGTVPIMLLAKVPDNLLNCCIEVISNKMCTITEVRIDQSSILSSINFINTSLQQSGETRRMLSELQITTTTQIQRCQENLIGGEVQIKQALRQMKREIKKQQYILPHIPDYSGRADNIIDTVITPSENLPEVKHVGRAIDQFSDSHIPGDMHSSTSDDSGESDFIYSKYCVKDQPLIQQLTDFKWINISQSDDGTSASFEAGFINIDTKPLKTRTRIEIYDEDNVGIDIPINLLNLLTKKKLKYMGYLTQDFIDRLQQYFE